MHERIPNKRCCEQFTNFVFLDPDGHTPLLHCAACGSAWGPISLDMATLQRRAIALALESAAGSITKAARILGLSRQTATRLADKLGVYREKRTHKLPPGYSHH